MIHLPNHFQSIAANLKDQANLESVALFKVLIDTADDDDKFDKLFKLFLVSLRLMFIAVKSIGAGGLPPLQPIDKFRMLPSPRYATVAPTPAAAPQGPGCCYYCNSVYSKS